MKISCLVKNLVKHDQKIINVTIDIHEKSLAKTKVNYNYFFVAENSFCSFLLS